MPLKCHTQLLTLTPDEVKCRICNGPTTSNGYAKMREIRHLPMNGYECYLRIKAKRGIC